MFSRCRSLSLCASFLIWVGLAAAPDARGASMLVAEQKAKLLPSVAAADDYFGYSVGLSGDTAVIGAWGVDTLAASRVGAAYVFVKSGATWSEQAKLMPAPVDNLEFGTAVAIAGDTILVGASGTAVGTQMTAGVVHVYVRSGTTWGLQATLNAPDFQQGDLFGRAVAIVGNTAVVGSRPALLRDLKGAAYVFVRSGTTWSEQARLAPSDSAYGDGFGSALGLSGDTLLVGADGASSYGGTSPGAAYVFVRNGTTWSQQAVLRAPDGAAYARFGQSVALQGDSALIGAPQANLSGMSQPGAAYLFQRSGTTWGAPVKLTAGDPGEFANFGSAAALSAVDVGAALVGASGARTAPAEAGGATYFFQPSGPGATQTNKLVAGDPKNSDRFGFSLALDGDTLLVGAKDASRPGLSFSGAAYVFALRSVKTPGTGCAAGGECLSGFCVDGVCCDSACGGGDDSDCQACSANKGAATDGQCAAVRSGRECRAAHGVCDQAERCDGVSLTCAADAPLVDGTSCPTGLCRGGSCESPQTTGDAGTSDPGNVPVGCGCRIAHSASVPSALFAAVLLALLTLVVRRRRTT